MIYSYCEQWEFMELYERLLALRLGVGPKQIPRLCVRFHTFPSLLAVPINSEHLALQSVRHKNKCYWLEIEEISKAATMLQYNDSLFIFGRTHDMDYNTKVSNSIIFFSCLFD